MAKLTKPILFIVILFLAGCGGKEAIPVYTGVIDKSGEITSVVAGKTSDASISKESFVHTTLQNRDLQYRKAYEKSGFKLKFAMVTVAGVQAYLPQEIIFRESPQFRTKLPTEPSRHPVWRTVEKVATTGIRWGTGAFVATEFIDMFEAAWGLAGANFYGDATLLNSQNRAGSGQTFTVQDLLKDQSQTGFSPIP